MKVEIFAEDDLWRSISNPMKRQHRLVFSYEDTTSSSMRAAADRAWHITNGAIMRLNEEDLAIRLSWDETVPGLAVSVNDVVRVDGTPFRCTTNGWDRI